MFKNLPIPKAVATIVLIAMCVIYGLAIADNVKKTNFGPPLYTTQRN